MNRLETFTVAVFRTPFEIVAFVVEDEPAAAAGGGGGAAFAAAGAFCVAEGWTSAGVAVPLADGVFPSLVTKTVMSFPCVSRRACGNALNRSSRIGGRSVLTRSKRAATRLESPVDAVMLYSY